MLLEQLNTISEKAQKAKVLITVTRKRSRNEFPVGKQTIGCKMDDDKILHIISYRRKRQPRFTKNRVYQATDGAKTAYITVDDTLHDETVDYFLSHPDTKFICIERALDTTKKFNLKNKMQDKFFAF